MFFCSPPPPWLFFYFRILTTFGRGCSKRLLIAVKYSMNLNYKPFNVAYKCIRDNTTEEPEVNGQYIWVIDN